MLTEFQVAYLMLNTCAMAEINQFNVPMYANNAR